MYARFGGTESRCGCDGVVVVGVAGVLGTWIDTPLPVVAPAAVLACCTCYNHSSILGYKLSKYVLI